MALILMHYFAGAGKTKTQGFKNYTSLSIHMFYEKSVTARDTGTVMIGFITRGYGKSAADHRGHNTHNDQGKEYSSSWLTYPDSEHRVVL